MDRPVLYTSTFTSGTLAHQAACVAGVPFEARFISLRRGEHKAPDYLAVNPKGEVPALRLPDGTVVTELPAILTWFAEAAPDSGLLPREPGPRIKTVEWMAWCHWSTGRHFNPAFAATRFTDGDEAAATAVRAAAVRRAMAALDFAEAALLRGGGTLAGTARPTAADIWLVSLAGFAGFLRQDVTHLAATGALAARVRAMPGVAAAMAREKEIG